MNRSLKWRLLGWTAGGMVLLLAVFAVWVYVATERALTRGFDDALATTARAIAASVKLDHEKAEVEFDEQEMPEFHRARRPDYYELWQDDGSVLKRSASLGERDLQRAAGTEGGPVFLTEALPDGRPGRAVVLRFRPRSEEERDGEESPASKSAPPAEQVILVVARETRALNTLLNNLRWQLALAGGGTVLLVLLAASIVVRQGLKPLGALAGRIAAIREDDLSARVPPDKMPAEIEPVAARLNELLDRLEDAFQRERALTADVAHELRTPLAGMRSTVEVALSRPRGAGEYQQALRDCLEIVQQAQGMTENLLALARLDSRQIPMRPEPVRLAEFVEAVWRPHAPQAEARRIGFHNLLAADLTCTADREILAIILSNLLANAAEYTNEGGRIEVSGRAAQGTVELSFTNTGCTLSAEEIAHVFDRFWRADSARTAAGVHCGLGLSLVQRAVHVMGGSIAAETDQGLFVVRAVVPASG
jgi:two-component system, OmpR family, heavy metal sensor histidine kinase CusS